MVDWVRLAAYLQDRVAGFRGPIEARAFDEGQSNPTYRLATPNGAYVLRKQPPGPLLRGAHAVDREYQVQASLWNTDVPVARVLHMCGDAAVIGTKFYLMDFAEGRIFWDPALPDLSPTERGQVYDEMNRVLAAIHSVDLLGTNLDAYGKPDGYFSRQLHIWTRQYRDAGGETIGAMEPLIDWLGRNLPHEDGQTTLVHGDYRIDNLLFEPDSLRIKAVFDWELSTLGHPLADLAYQVMQRSMGRDWHLRGLDGLNTEALGIPSEEEYVATYCERRGLQHLKNWHFAKVFAFFRFAAICHGVGARAATGNAASPDAERVGAMAAPLAELGLDLLDRSNG
jgi:aminoglycoside phosphotransferase (APT) family kinase protein